MNRQMQRLSLSKETVHNLQHIIQALDEDDNPSGYTCGRPTDCWANNTCKRSCAVACQR
jgi:hypothetical protein